jgi:DNA-3-methyladenine glycosylase II
MEITKAAQQINKIRRILGDGCMEFTITPVPPYDFQKMMKRLTVTGKTHSIILNEELTKFEKIVRISKVPCQLKVTSKGTVDQPILHCQVNPLEGEIKEEEAKKKIQQLFSTELDIEPLYEAFAEHKELVTVLERFKGLKLLTDTDLFESIVKIIIGQQVNLTFAGTLTDRLIKIAGEEIEVAGESYQLFPAAENIARLTYEDLRTIQFSQRKAEYIIDLARLIVDGKLNLESLWDVSDEEVMAELLPIRGIGKWTIECLLIFGMGRPDVLPAADIGLRNAMRLVWNLSEQPSEEDVRQLAEDWKPWRTYVTYYLWESLNQTPSPVDHI